MKKRKVQKLNLNKKAISTLENSLIKGGNETQRTACTVCCWVDETYPCSRHEC